MSDRDLCTGLIRLHVLHHAATAPIYGQEMMEELSHHGYRLSPGTLYPMLHGLEMKGYLKSSRGRNGKVTRRTCRLSVKGQRALQGAKARVGELFGDLFDDAPV
ncbi:MAG: PadR family transcriptional regulator [Xanthomonadaceae bacterium]|nr:PadR family transcriptional regulator [Xanthomonadaceae bacterium]